MIAGKLFPVKTVFYRSRNVYAKTPRIHWMRDVPGKVFKVILLE
jgi:hypothetical protein